MAEKKITRKVISSRGTSGAIKDEVVNKKAPVQEETSEAEVSRVGKAEEGRMKKVCTFCQNKTVPTYTDIVTLRRFVTDRAKIVPRARSGACSRHQRAVTRNIKYARHLAMLPFTPKV
jgi:small subunit ribosomal protein S18